MKEALFVLIFVLTASAMMASAQVSPAKASAAYAEVLLRKTEVFADAEALAPEHNEDSPRMLDLRYEAAGLDRYLLKLLASPDGSKLTAALGKLIVKRMALDTELNKLSRTVNAAQPDYKRAKRRLDIFDAAIKEILS